MQVSEFKFGHRQARLYCLSQQRVPLVYYIDYNEQGEPLLQACREAGCDMGFNLVTLSGLHWDEELTPWPSPPVVSRADRFTGGGPDLLRLLTTSIMPQVEQRLPQPAAWRVLAGYSLAGLFAVWAMHGTDEFAGCLSASGSMWYPDILPWMQSHAMSPTVRRVYLSLGDKESRSRNAALRVTQDNTLQLARLFAHRGVTTRFVLNPGNHFQQAMQRVASGIVWHLTPIHSNKPHADWAD